MRPLLVTLLLLSACSNGNLTPTTGLSGPAAVVRNPYFDPYAPPGTAPAAWVAPVFDAHGTIVRPRDPVVERTFPDYDHAPWLLGNSPDRPAGTF